MVIPLQNTVMRWLLSHMKPSCKLLIRQLLTKNRKHFIYMLSHALTAYVENMSD